MATWAAFSSEAPDLAAVAQALWPGVCALAAEEQPLEGGPTFSVAYLATVRRDGGPRLHPFCPIIAGGRLFAAIPPSSPNGWDLRRDPRCVVHAMPGPDDDELCIRALAREVVDDPTRTLVRDVVVRSGVGGMIESVSKHPIFELDLQQVDVARWLQVGKAGTSAVRSRWSAT
ncbi:MAG: hypothetical protein ACT4OV_08175 [Microthrixaceae bacterium]